MDFKTLASPNLPERPVTHIAVSDYSPSLLKKADELGIITVKTIKTNKLNNCVCYHTDMLINNISEGLLLADESQNANIVKYLTIGYKTNIISDRVKSPYPEDSLLNAVVLGDKLICSKTAVCKELLEFAEKSSMQIISVKQGYTKCSTCIVSANAVITDDKSVYRTCADNGIDALYISKGSVKLEGFDYGFIGGCTGLIDKNRLLFNGDINYHKDCNKIIDFIKKYDINAEIIENKPLTDIGGILPLCEKTT